MGDDELQTQASSDRDNPDTYRDEVKPFGDGGAHITVPSTLIGETVEVSRLDWDETLDGEIMRENGEQFATCIETPVGKEVYAPPNVRERFTEQPEVVDLGVLQRKGDMIQTPDMQADAAARDSIGEKYTLPMGVLESHVTVLGDSGNGKPAFMSNLAYQYAFTDPEHGFCVIGDENGGIGDFTSLLEARNIEFEYIDTTTLSGSDEVREVVSNITTGVPVVAHVPMAMHTGGTGITSAVIDGLTETAAVEGTGAFPVFIDSVPPEEFAVSQLSAWDDCGVSLVMGVHYLKQFSDGVVQWLMSNTEVMSFSVTPETAGGIADELSVADPDVFVGRACGLNRGEVLLCERDEAVVLTYPRAPPV